ncbi:unnamed protein product [Linum trigynum]|uniref:Uncharacterized protein n=1 Tax=Linum trigynum TaxID=586398 RepID=A0AAV2FTP2_9ROSI
MKSSPTASIGLDLATNKKSTNTSGGNAEEERRENAFSASKRAKPSKLSLRQRMMADHKVIVGRRPCIPTREKSDEEGKNLDLDAEITIVNEKKKVAENGVVGLGRVREFAWVKSPITVCEM